MSKLDCNGTIYFLDDLKTCKKPKMNGYIYIYMMLYILNFIGKIIFVIFFIDKTIF